MNAPQNIRSIEQRYDQDRRKSSKSCQGYSEDDIFGAHDPFHGMFGVRMHWFFAIMAILALPLYRWTWHWWQSGTPLLIFVLLSGRLGRLSKSPKLLAWTIININIAYTLFSTSWLFYDMYLVTCYSAILVLAFFSSTRLRRQNRQLLRYILKGFYFGDDKLGFFDIPAIDIDDGDVPCLLVIRGFTFTFSTMTLEVHGVEVGVKLNDDIDIAIQTDSFVWRIMREIKIGDVYASLKGPFTQKSKLLPEDSQDNHEAEESLTENQKPVTTRNLSGIQAHSDFDSLANEQYMARLQNIARTNTTYQARKEVVASIIDTNQRRAAIGAKIFQDRSVPNPPKRQIKSSYLNSLVPSWVKRLFHRVPVLLRLFLNPVSYNHPVHFQSIVLTGCGKYVNQILDAQFFKYYPNENKEIRKLKDEVETFLVNGRFSVVLPEIIGLASVPFLTQYDIITFIKAPKVYIHKSVQDEKTQIALKVEEIVEITGLAATFSIPSFLLPHHEHLLPEVPTEVDQDDAALVKMSLLASLPGKFHPEMVDFAITILKASQVLTLHKQATSMSNDVHSAVQFGKLLGQATVEQTKKKLVEAHVDDAWLYRLIMKGVKALRNAKGDIGYQMDIPVALKELRPNSFVRRSSINSVSSDTQIRRSSWKPHASNGSEIFTTQNNGIK